MYPTKTWRISLQLPVIFTLIWTSLFSWGFGSGAPKAWIGISFIDIPQEQLGKWANTTGPKGAVQIQEVFPGSSAALGGLLKGDIILILDGTALDGRRSLMDVMAKKKSGDKVQLTLLRGNKKISQTLSLSPRPEELSALTKTLVGSLAPDLSGKSLDGKIKDLKSLRGKAVILDFWASWCGPCRVSHPMLERIQQKFYSRGLRVLGLSTETPAEIQAYLKQAQLSFPQWVDVSAQTPHRYGAYALPTLVFISSDGIVRRVYTGVPQGPDLLQFVEEILPPVRD